MAPIYLGKRVVPSSLRYIENLAIFMSTYREGSFPALIMAQKRAEDSSPASVTSRGQRSCGNMPRTRGLW